MDGKAPVLIGVKYCGGCNERYDRMGAYRGIISRCSPQTRFEATAGREGEEFDLILVLCGCQAQCPNTSKLKSRHGMLSLYQNTDFEAVVGKIHEIETLHGYRE